MKNVRYVDEELMNVYDSDFPSPYELDNYGSEVIDAPTLQMAMKWLCEVHNMYYEIQLLLGEKAEKYGGLQLGIYQLDSSGAYVWKDWIYADTYLCRAL